MTQHAVPFVIGLTGSIGMGKSTVGQFFADEGAALWNADEAVHRLYRPGQAGAEALSRLVPQAVGDRGVDRAALSASIASDPELLTRIEAVIHPLVAEDRRAFLRDCAADIAVLDIPLLLEGRQGGFDCIVVVSAAPDVQRARVLQRPGMTPEKFAMILSRQMPDARKRALADVVIPTDVPLEETRRLVQTLVAEIRQRQT